MGVFTGHFWTATVRSILNKAATQQWQVLVRLNDGNGRESACQPSITE